MLDTVEAGLDHGADAVVAVRVRGDLESGAVRFVGDRPQLLVGVLLRTGRPGVRHDAARRADLDHLRAVLDLVPNRLAHLAHTVGDAFLDGQRHDVGRERLEHGGVEVTAGGRDRVTRGNDAGPVDPTEVDRLHQRDVEQQAAGLNEQPEVAHGREPGAQRSARVGDGAQGAQRGVVLHRVQRARVVGAAEQQVDLHVHEPGEEGEVAEVEHGRVGRDGARGDGDDVLRVDEQLARRHDLAGVDVEQSGTAQQRGRLRGTATGHGGPWREGRGRRTN